MIPLPVPDVDSTRMWWRNVCAPRPVRASLAREGRGVRLWLGGVRGVSGGRFMDIVIRLQAFLKQITVWLSTLQRAL